MKFPSFKKELEYIKEGYVVAGCDEVGRGPLAGPVVAAACILDPNSIGSAWHARVRDSKTVSEKERGVLLEKILAHTLAHGLGIVWQDEIDKINIHNASLLAMRRAVDALCAKIKSEKIIILLDGKFKIPDLAIEQKVVIGGDGSVLSIAAASIIAKVHRDGIMRELHKKFPDYGFESHKGYPTPAHKAAIKKHGPTEIHRKSFIKML